MKKICSEIEVMGSIDNEWNSLCPKANRTRGKMGFNIQEGTRTKRNEDKKDLCQENHRRNASRSPANTETREYIQGRSQGGKGGKSSPPPKPKKLL